MCYQWPPCTRDWVCSSPTSTGKVTDAEVYALELSLAAGAEASGFDSVWMSEHHFADYQLTSQTPMILSWLAGQTQRIKLGTMVTVLPWHDPLRVAESFSVLDHVSGGRAILGIGRGLGQKEFVGFRVAMGESRRRFTEYSEAILEALETGVMDYDGELYKQPRVEIRPQPLATFKGRTFASAVSPESMEIMARMGVGLMVIAQKPWETAEAELEAYRQRFSEVQRAPRRPSRSSSSWSVRPRTGPRPTSDPRRLPAALGPLDGGALRVRQRRVRPDRGLRVLRRARRATSTSTGSSSSTASSPTCRCGARPTRCTEKLLDYVERTDAGGLVVVPLSFGGMPADEVRAGFDLFATEVLPELQRHDVGGDIGVTYDAAPAALR